MSGELDAFNNYADKTCEALNAENSILEKMENATGLNTLMDGFNDIVKNGPMSILTTLFGPDSALRAMGEDVLSQMINDNARKLSQAVMGELGPALKTLADVRDQAFNAMVTTLTFKNDMVLYFAAETAKETILLINEKDLLLQHLLEQVRKLHNALLVLAGGGPFFNGYLKDLRKALILVHEAENELALTRSAFNSTDIFPVSHYNNVRINLETAYNLIMPPEPGPEGAALDKGFTDGFLKNVLTGPDYSTQLSMLTVIPKLTMELLKSYDLYVIKVLKVNALLLGFQTIVQNLEKVSNSMYKEMVIKTLRNAEFEVHDIVADMAYQLNGDEAIIDADKMVLTIDDVGNATLGKASNDYKPDVTKTSAKALKWGLRVKMAQGTVEMVAVDSINKVAQSNAALQAYYDAQMKMSLMDDMISPLAIVKAKNAIEAPGGFEADMIKFSIEANHALVDTSLLESEPSSMNPRSVLSIGAKLSAEIELILERDQDIIDVLQTFVSTTKGSMDGLKRMGDSMFKLLDKLGLDRASDSLKHGAFGDFFSMSGKTGSYIGAAITGLTMVQSLTASTAQKECINNTINELVVAETSKTLVAKRTSKENFARQQTRNVKRCEKLKKEKEKVASCSVGLDISSLISNPASQLSKVMGGLFDDGMFESLETIPNPIKGVGEIAAGKNAIASIRNASDKIKSAKSSMASAINQVEGYKASAEEDLAALNSKLESAKKIASGDVSEMLAVAGVDADVAKKAKETAAKAVKTVKTSLNEFAGDKIDAVKGKIDEIKGAVSEDIPEKDLTELTSIIK